MPRLREAKIPFGRQLFLVLLKIANACIILFGALTVVLSFEINPTPTFSPGWLLIFLGATTMLGGFTGFGGTTLPCCYKSHLIFMSIAIFGTIIFDLVMFGQRAKVVATFKSTRFPEAKVDHYISQVSGAYVFAIIFEGLAVAARVFYQRIANHEQFESLSQTQESRSVALGQMRQDLGMQSNRVGQSKMLSLDNKMKDKCDKWSHQDLG